MEEDYNTEDYNTEDSLTFDFEEFQYSDLTSPDGTDFWVTGSVDASKIKIDSTWFE